MERFQPNLCVLGLNFELTDGIIFVDEAPYYSLNKFPNIIVIHFTSIFFLLKRYFLLLKTIFATLDSP